MMASGYTKEFLVEAIVSRYTSTFRTLEEEFTYRDMIESYYDRVGKDQFRVSASLDAAAIKKYKATGAGG